jgi:arabinan endo-1,5-alpha-L-arabinosidase
MRAVLPLLLVALAACGDGCDDGSHAICHGCDAYHFEDAPHCSTRISYGATWIRPTGHTDNFDDVEGAVSWDGTCTDDGANSYALLSNGFKPYFTGNQACAIALVPTELCPTAGTCSTRITYAPTWAHPANHPAQYDDVDGRIFSDGSCTTSGSESIATLSNGWQPHFTGADSCGMSFRWTNCAGIYENPVIPIDCPDPHVTYDDVGHQYGLVCTSGNASDAFPVYTSKDLVTWTLHGHIFSPSTKPAWAVSDFWAPEIHRMASQWVIYFTARGADGKLAIGAAYSDGALDNFVALPSPLIHSDSVGLIDATVFGDGMKRYIVWKEDGNAQNQPTPIMAAELSANGMSVVGNATQLITNDQTWEGNLVEAPSFVRWDDGFYYLFYSGNAYYDDRYAVGVAKASSPLGPYTKYAANPILATSAEWVGPGHCAFAFGPTLYTTSEQQPIGVWATDVYMIYHAWQAGHVNGPGDGRMVLVDQIQWGYDGWPHMVGAPSSTSRPSP